MKTKAVRMYGKEALRLEEFALPAIRSDEILAEIVSDSICMSTWKAAEQGAEHKRVPKDIAEHPVIVGHEFCGRILEVGEKWKDRFKPGQKYAIQPALNYKGSLYSPGYSYRFIGGAATRVVIPNEVMELGCLLDYQGDAYYYGSLSEPMSCIVGTFHAMYHTENGKYEHKMGIVPGGAMAILAGAGPMGMGAIDYAVHCDRKPGLLVVTDIDDARLGRAAAIYTPEEAAKHGVRLVYVNTSGENPVGRLLALTDGRGYDDVLVFAPVKPVVEQGDAILGRDGCLNFFAGPADRAFSAMMNFYNVHYASTHVVGTSGGNTADMVESLAMMSDGRINPSSMITHVGGLDSVIPTTLNLPKIPGGKKLIYTQLAMELTAISDFEEKGKGSRIFAALAEIVKSSGGLWCPEAEKYLLEHGRRIS
jgi:threonine dehydrogenase-like Zn-dependent dehydrogenase